jgi:hypothetical protein
MATPRKANPAKRGRRSDYNRAFHPDEAYRLALLGLTDEQLAGVFQVNTSTVERWKLRHPEFCESVTRGRVRADGQVIEALFKRALGYSHRSEEIFCTKEGAIVRARTTKHYPPDTKAASIWLFNRQRALWRNHVEVEHTEHRPLEHLSDAELEAAAGLGPARGADRAGDPEGAAGTDSVH